MDFRRWRAYPIQLFVLTVLPLTALLLAISLGALSLHSRAMRELVGERDVRAARAAAAAITEQLNHRAKAVHGVALRAAAGGNAAEILADISFLLPDFDSGLALFSPDGALRAASSGGSWWESAAVKERLAEIDRTPGHQFLTLLEEDGEPIMLVASAAGDGSFGVGAFSPGSMIQRVLTRVFSTGSDATAFVISGEGTLLAQTGRFSQVSPDLGAHPGAAGALRGESGTNYLSTDEHEFVIAFSPVAVTGWALVIEEPWQSVTDPMLRSTEMAPLLLIPLLVISFIGLWFGYRQIVQPLQMLEQQATALGWGEFSAIEEPVGGIAEIDRLQKELIHMARKVQSGQQSLRGYLGAVTAGQEEERRRLAREIHDETIQALIALNQRLQLAQMRTVESSEAGQLAEMEGMVAQIIGDLRRVTRDLRPIYLEDLGLLPALDMLAGDTSAKMGIPVSFRSSGEPGRLLPAVELGLYRMAQEGLSNVARHSQATEGLVGLDFEADGVRLWVRDNGQGFEVPESPAEMAPAGHFGLLGLQERAELLGAQLTIESAPGKGCRLEIWLENDGGAAQLKELRERI